MVTKPKASIYHQRPSLLIHRQGVYLLIALWRLDYLGRSGRIKPSLLYPYRPLSFWCKANPSCVMDFVEEAREIKGSVLFEGDTLAKEDSVSLQVSSGYAVRVPLFTTFRWLFLSLHPQDSTVHWCSNPNPSSPRNAAFSLLSTHEKQTLKGRRAK